MYTSHGHHIKGSVMGDDRPHNVARCGGPGLCGPCSREAQAWQQNPTTEKEQEQEQDNRPGTATDRRDPILQCRLAVMTAFSMKDPAIPVGVDNFYVVSFCYILGGWKAMLSSTFADDRYYEVTHRADHDGSDGPEATFVDCYRKEYNVHLPADHPIHSV